MLFVPDEPFEPVPLREPFDQALAVLSCSLKEIARNAGVKRAVMMFVITYTAVRIRSSRIG
jgi:hypothetical protein